MHVHDIVLTIVVAVVFGVLAHELRVPALVGFLGAGFLLGALDVAPFPGLEELANLGVTLLLFTIGLKFDLRSLVHPEAYGTALLHMIASVIVGGLTVALAVAIGIADLDGDWRTLALLGFALSFSSTVLCVKVLEERSDDGSYYGQTAIAILVIQDLAAVVFFTVTGDEPPSPWAFALILLLPMTWVLRRMLERVGHGELLVLFGVVVALGPGYHAFEAVGIHGDLGALIMGALLATHPRSLELSKALFSVKELFLVGFFIVIGIQSTPTWEDLELAGLLCLLLIPFTFVGFVLLGRLFGLRNRTSIRSSLALSNFSEFSIIVVVVGVAGGLFDERWISPISLAVALSMIISSLANAHSLSIAAFFEGLMPDENPAKLRPQDRPIDTSDADVVVLGMGRVGRAAYSRLVDHRGLKVIGIDNDHAVVSRLRKHGFKVLEGDATDHEFWQRLVAGGFVPTVILAMAIHDSNAFAIDQLRAAGFDGHIAAVVQRPDQVEHLESEGVEAIINIYAGAGSAVADAAMALLEGEGSPAERVADDDSPEQPPTGV